MSSCDISSLWWTTYIEVYQSRPPFVKDKKGRNNIMPTKKPKVGAYIEPELAKKFSIIAKNNCRTVSKQLEYLIIQEVEKYENEKGKIQI